MNSIFLHHVALLPVYKQIVPRYYHYLNRCFQTCKSTNTVNMHEESTVSIKVYLMEGNNNIEVRRFEVDHGVITNYDYMRERLQMAIPKLREMTFKLLWQDADGDEVTVSSDVELMIALSELKSNVVKLIARMPTKSTEQSEAHMSFTAPSMFDLYSSASNWTDACPLFAEMQGDQNCHSCQKPITDHRYRCLECVQYFQCGDCEHKNVHPDHVIIRFSKNSVVATLIPKFIQIIKSHFVRGMRCPGMSFRDKKYQCYNKEKDDDKERGKHGHHHHKKFRKHCGEKYSSTNANENEAPKECPFNPQIYNNLEDVVGAFLGMCKNAQTKQQENVKQSENEAGSSVPKNAAPKTAEFPSGPPMPSTAGDDNMDEDEPATSKTESQKDIKLKMAVELLSEMGFNNDNKWLSQLLDHFDGDISKIIDHLTLGK